MKIGNKRHSILLLAMIAILSVCVLIFASCGNEPTDTVTIRYEDSEGGVTITGYTGTLAPDTDFKIPESIDGKEVVSIADGAFAGREDLVKLTLPMTVKSIGKGAFKNCKKLEFVNIPEGISEIKAETFLGCVALKEVNLPDSVTAVADNAYAKCTSVEHLSSPAFALERFNLTSLKSLNVRGDMTVTEGMFKDLTSIETLTIPYIGWNIDATVNTHFGYIFGAKSADENASAVPSSLKKVVITGAVEGKSLEKIDAKAFYGCSSINNIILPKTVKAIGESAFEGCSALTKMNIPALVTSIGNSAFAGSDIESATIPAGVAHISDKLFFGCDNLKSLTLGKSVATVGNEAFAGCTALTSLNVPTLTQWLSFSFDDAVDSPLYYAGKLLIGGKDADEIVIPSEIKAIGKNAFYRCTNVKKVVLHNDITSIGDYAFAGCTSLEVASVNGSESSGTLPSSLTAIGYAAFSNCPGIKAVTIPKSVKNIGDFAYNLCSSLKTVVINAEADKLGEKTFRGTAITSLTVNSKISTVSPDAFADVTRIQTATVPLSVASAISMNSLRNITITDGTSIPNGMFLDAKNLTTVKLAESIESIGYSAFSGCSALVSVDFGANSKLTSISAEAFYACTMLTSITIPEKVSEIGLNAFDNCMRLVEVRNCSTLDISRGSTENGRVAMYALGVIGAKDASAIEIDGNFVFYKDTELRLIAYLGQNTVVTLPNRTYSIAKYAFAYSDIRVLTIPSSVISSDPGAFMGAASITELEATASIIKAMPTSVRNTVKILNVISDKDASIPVSLNSAVISGFISLESLTINSSVDSIDASALAEYKNLSKITVDEANAVYYSVDGHLYKKGANGNVLVRACPMSADYFTLDTTIVEIGDYAFANCTLLTSVYIEPGSVLKTIGEGAFRGCSILYSLELPASVSKIGEMAFAFCDYLSEIEFTGKCEAFDIVGGCLIDKANKTVIVGFGEKVGNIRVITVPSDGSVTMIAPYAVSGKLTLQGIIIPKDVKIGENAFFGIPELEVITVAEDNTSYKVEGGCLIETVSGTLILAATTVYNEATGKNEPITIPESVKRIAKSAFFGNGAITSIVIPSTVTKIDAGAFDGCISLTNVTAPAWAIKYFDSQTVTNLTISDGEITSYMLEGFSVLESVTIGKGVTSISEGAFKDATLLTKITVDAENTLFKVEGGCLIDVKGAKVITAVVIADGNAVPQTGVTSIGAYAFAGKAFVSVIIPQAVTSVDMTAFIGVETLVGAAIPVQFIERLPGTVTSLTLYGTDALTKDAIKRFSALKEITLASTISGFEAGVFSENSTLTSIKIEGEGGAYIAKDGCLINVEAKTLVAAVGNAIVPLDGSVTAIGDYAFAGNTSVTAIAIPKDATIGNSAFSGCTSLAKIYYYGTDFAADSANAECPSGVTVYVYSEEKPTTEGSFWYIKDGKITIWW